MFDKINLKLSNWHIYSHKLKLGEMSSSNNGSHGIRIEIVKVIKANKIDVFLKVIKANKIDVFWS